MWFSAGCVAHSATSGVTCTPFNEQVPHILKRFPQPITPSTPKDINKRSPNTLRRGEPVKKPKRAAFAHGSQRRFPPDLKLSPVASHHTKPQVQGVCVCVTQLLWPAPPKLQPQSLHLKGTIWLGGVSGGSSSILANHVNRGCTAAGRARGDKS